MEVRSFFDQLRAQGEARGKAEARAQLKASALEAVRLAAPELVSNVSKLDDAEQILQRLNEHLRTRGH